MNQACLHLLAYLWHGVPVAWRVLFNLVPQRIGIPFLVTLVAVIVCRKAGGARGAGGGWVGSGVVVRRPSSSVVLFSGCASSECFSFISSAHKHGGVDQVLYATGRGLQAQRN